MLSWQIVKLKLDDDAIDEALDRQMSYMANQMMAQGIQLDQYLQMNRYG